MKFIKDQRQCLLLKLHKLKDLVCPYGVLDVQDAKCVVSSPKEVMMANFMANFKLTGPWGAQIFVHTLFWVFL